jgi:hypothetical protein
MQALVSASRVPDSAISREAHPPYPGKVTHSGDAPRRYRTLECSGRGTSTRGKVLARRKQPEHLERIITKLEVSDRTQAAVKALDLGLVDPERAEG